MTIALSLKVNDGLVLAADSASTVLVRNPDGNINVANIYNNSNKVFNLYKGLPIGMVTWGAGNIGTASITTLAKDLRDRLSGRNRQFEDWRVTKDDYSISAIAHRVKEFMFDELYAPAFQDWTDKPSLGFIVAGYSARAGMAEEYRIEVNGGQVSGPDALRNQEEAGITWSGAAEPINRLLLGFSGNLPTVLQQNLGVPSNQIQIVVDTLKQALTAPLAVPAMPLQDAIDLAEFLVDVTIGFSRFAPGAPVVGGPIEIATISKHEHFKWIRRKHYFKREFNPEDSEYDTNSQHRHGYEQRGERGNE